MFITFWVLNNITAHRIFHICCRILSNNFRYQANSEFNKLNDQNGNKNTAKFLIPIFLVIKINIGLTRLLKDNIAIINYDSEKKLCEGSQRLDWVDDKDIKKVVANVIIFSFIIAYHIDGMIRNSCQLYVSHVTVMLSFVLYGWANKRSYISFTLYLDFCFFSPSF